MHILNNKNPKILSSLLSVTSIVVGCMYYTQFDKVPSEEWNLPRQTDGQSDVWADDTRLFTLALISSLQLTS